jgi:hypothetical protein
MVVIQIIIILITLMLGLTLKLKDYESITTDDVVKGSKSDKVVKKIETISLGNDLDRVRKDIVVPPKRDLKSYPEEDAVVSPPKDKPKTDRIPPVSGTGYTSNAAASQKSTPRREIVSNIKK